MKTEGHLEHQLMGSSEVYFNDHASKKLVKWNIYQQHLRASSYDVCFVTLAMLEKISIFLHYKESYIKKDNLLDTFCKL